jgi:predicted methyltransferase
MRTVITVAVCTIAVAACGRDAEAPATTPAAAEPEVSVYAAALASETRPEGDLAADASRKPAAVLEFLGIGPGDIVLEMWGAGGYYTELLSNVVGPTGKVIAHNNTPSLNFAGEAHANRHADNRLPNVELLLAENNQLALDESRFDAITIILNYHDLYWVSEQYGWVAIDVPPFLAELYKGLKPGGVLGVVDHHAEPGSPAEMGNTLHRIDSAIVIADLEAAGFVLDGQSDMLLSGADNYNKNVFDPAVRGKTDRFLMRFRKPQE